MKSRDPAYPTLSLLRAAIMQVEVDTQKELTDEDLLTIIGREIKKRRDAIADYVLGGRQELADKETFEMTVLQKYLPAQMSDEELLKIITDTITELGLTDPAKIGILLGQVMPKVKGKADGNTVSRLAKTLLAERVSS